MEPRIIKNAWTAINLVLITLLTYLSVQAVYTLATAGLTGDLSTPPSSGATDFIDLPAQTRQPSIRQYTAITDRNLFDTTTETQSPKTKPTPKPKTKAPEPTQLKLTLWGTVTGSTEMAYAIIEDGRSKAQNLKKIGDGIQNAIIKAIHRDHVILDVEGQDEILKLEEFRTDKTRRTTARRQPAAPATRRQGDTAASDRVTVQQDQIESAVKNVNTLMKQVRIRPHFKDGKPDGLLLTGIRPGSIFADMGLKSGDIITGVDDNAIESLDDALKFYQSLKSAKDVKLEIRRRGQPRTIDYTIE